MWTDMRRPVDLTTGPLFTMAVFKAAPERFFLYLRGHHIAMDGFSSSLLCGRIAQVIPRSWTDRIPGRGFWNRFLVCSSTPTAPIGRRRISPKTGGSGWMPCQVCRMPSV